MLLCKKMSGNFRIVLQIFLKKAIVCKKVQNYIKCLKAKIEYFKYVWKQELSHATFLNTVHVACVKKV